MTRYSGTAASLIVALVAYARTTVSIPTEEPEEEQWRLLRTLTYSANVRRHVAAHGLEPLADDDLEFVSGCLRQSEAYFRSAASAPLDISPLLLYYGATNLLAGSALLITGKRLPISGHGMRLKLSSRDLAEAKITPNQEGTGGLQNFANVYSDGIQLVTGDSWTLREVFALLPDIRTEYATCYSEAEPHSVPIERIRTPSGTVERIEPSELERVPSISDALDLVEGLRANYLAPQYGPGMKYVVLRPKRNGEDIGVYSLMGQKHLQLAIRKGRALYSPSLLLVMTMALYALAFLSRYKPETWNPFLRLDTSGEVLLVVKFLAVCRRRLPNLVLDEIHGRRHMFSRDLEAAPDTTALSSMEELHREIRQRVSEELTKRGIAK